MVFKTVRGSVEPKATDFTSSPGMVYVREDIHTVEVEAMDETITEWEYRESLMTMEEYSAYAQAKALETQTAMDETLAEILLKQV